MMIFLAKKFGDSLNNPQVQYFQGTLRLNGKVERSHRTYKQDFYQLLNYKDDQDLGLKLKYGRTSTTSIALIVRVQGNLLTKCLKLKMMAY